MVEELPDDFTISIFVSTDGYEMVVPVLDKNLNRVNSFIGMDTATAYDHAKLRTDRELGSYRIQTRMGNWPNILGWFSLTDKQAANLNNMSANWMIGIADRVKNLGYDGESIIDLEAVNTAIKKDNE